MEIYSKRKFLQFERKILDIQNMEMLKLDVCKIFSFSNVKDPKYRKQNECIKLWQPQQTSSNKLK